MAPSYLEQGSLSFLSRSLSWIEPGIPGGPLGCSRHPWDSWTYSGEESGDSSVMISAKGRIPHGSPCSHCIYPGTGWENLQASAAHPTMPRSPSAFQSSKQAHTHSSVLAWRIPETGEPGGPPSIGSHRVGHDWSNLAAAAAGSQSSPSNNNPVMVNSLLKTL